jgi:hypothetical protein
MPSSTIRSTKTIFIIIISSSSGSCGSCSKAAALVSPNHSQRCDSNTQVTLLNLITNFFPAAAAAVGCDDRAIITSVTSSRRRRRLLLLLMMMTMMVMRGPCHRQVHRQQQVPSSNPYCNAVHS